jgi:hypothetical protein
VSVAVGAGVLVAVGEGRLGSGDGEGGLGSGDGEGGLGSGGGAVVAEDGLGAGDDDIAPWVTVAAGVTVAVAVVVTVAVPGADGGADTGMF